MVRQLYRRNRVAVAVPYYAYAQKVCNMLHEKGLWANVNLGADTLNKKIRNGKTESYNYVFVVGEDEMSNETVNVCEEKKEGEKGGKGVIWPLQAIISALVKLKDEKRLVQDLVQGNKIGPIKTVKQLKEVDFRNVFSYRWSSFCCKVHMPLETSIILEPRRTKFHVSLDKNGSISK